MVSLSVTPMICAYFVRAAPSHDATWLDRLVEGDACALDPLLRPHAHFVLDHRCVTLIVFVGTIALTVGLYVQTPKGYFPQDDTGLIFGGTQASTDISFEAMEALQLKAMDIVLADPAVAGLGSSVGASGFNASVNHGRLFISLKPLDRARQCEHAARGRAAARQARRTFPASASSWCRRRTCASAGGRAIRNISSRCGAPISTSCRTGCRRCWTA